MVKVVAEPWPRENPPWLASPGLTNSRLVPSDSILWVMDCWTPFPMDMRVMTAATPITTPNSVKPARILLAPKEERAVNSMVWTFM